jgi:hypothetical protein
MGEKIIEKKKTRKEEDSAWVQGYITTWPCQHRFDHPLAHIFLGSPKNSTRNDTAGSPNQRANGTQHQQHTQEINSGNQTTKAHTCQINVNPGKKSKLGEKSMSTPCLDAPKI